MRITFLVILFLFFIDKAICQNIFPYSNNGELMFVDSSFNRITKNKYSFIFPFNDNRAIVRKKNKYGVIDTLEKIIIPFKYDTIINWWSEFYCLKKNKKHYLNREGKPFKPIMGCGGNLGILGKVHHYSKDNKIGILIFNERPIPPDSLPNIYDFMLEYTTGLAVVKTNNKWGVINENDSVIIPITLDSIAFPEHESYYFERYELLKYYSSNRIGFINKSGKIITEPKFKDSYFTMDKFTLVKTLDDRLVYIDNTGKEYFK